MIKFYALSYDGEKYPLEAITKFEIIKSMDSPTTSLMIERYPEKQPIHTRNILFENGEEIICFFVDEEKSEFTNGIWKHYIEARDEGGVLIDNEAMPAKFENIGFYDIYSSYIKRLCGFKNKIFRSGFAGKFNIGKGASVWQAAKKFCAEVYKKEPYVCNGDILLFERKASKRLQGRIIGFCEQAKPCKIISAVWLQSANGEYKAVEENGEAKGIVRERYLASLEEWQESERSADKIIRKSLSESIEYKVWIDGEEKIGVGQEIEFSIGENEYKNLAVIKVVLSCTENGLLTAVTATKAEYL